MRMSIQDFIFLAVSGIACCSLSRKMNMNTILSTFRLIILAAYADLIGKDRSSVLSGGIITVHAESQLQ
jgi:hypothetical protein